MTVSEGGQITGTKDKNSNLVWFTKQCLNNALRPETYAQDAERDGDTELALAVARCEPGSMTPAEGGGSGRLGSWSVPDSGLARCVVVL